MLWLTLIPIVAATSAASDSPDLPEWQKNSNLAKDGYMCPTQFPNDLRIWDHPTFSEDLYDAIVNQPGVMGLKHKSGDWDSPITKNDMWTMEWVPVGRIDGVVTSTIYKTITINWSIDRSTGYIYWQGAYTTVVRIPAFWKDIPLTILERSHG